MKPAQVEVLTAPGAFLVEAMRAEATLADSGEYGVAVAIMALLQAAVSVLSGVARTKGRNARSVPTEKKFAC
jgi:hypothetical protein